MNGDGESTASTLTANVRLSVAGVSIEAQIEVPAGPTRSIQLLPILQSLTDTVVEIAVGQVTTAGLKVTCRAGCGACCRQLVPVSQPEARRIADLVANMPIERRLEIRRRFAEARERLKQANLLEMLLFPEQFPDFDVMELGLTYFREHIACPFLEDESCSIHPDRPLACREYLVTSPAEHCAQPSSESVRMVSMPLKVSSALNRLGSEKTDRFARYVPLILALEWVASHPEEPPNRTGAELLGEIFERLTGQAPPSPPKDASGRMKDEG